MEFMVFIGLSFLFCGLSLCALMEFGLACSVLLATSNTLLASVLLSAGATFEDIIALIFLSYALHKQKIEILTHYALFRTLLLISAYVFVSAPDESATKLIAGTAACVLSSAMYGYRVIVIKQVIKTRSSEQAPLLVALFAFLVPFAFGFIPDILRRNFAVIPPTGFASCLGAVQLILSLKFCSHKVQSDNLLEPEKAGIKAQSQDEVV